MSDTVNYGLPLPHPANHMASDCEKIRAALVKADAELKRIEDDITGEAEARQEAINGCLSKAGDTMTEPLQMVGSSLSIHNLTGEIAVPPDVFNAADIQFRDKNGAQVACLQHGFEPSGDSIFRMLVRNRTSPEAPNRNSWLTMVQQMDGTDYVTCPPPRENAYANDVDTLYASINRHSQKTVPGSNNFNFYAGNVAGASDTADLYKGRGLSEANPFLTLSALAMFISQSYAMRYAPTINLLSDLEIPSAIMVYSHNQLRWQLNGNGHSLIYKGSSPICPLAIGGGGLWIHDINFKAETPVTFFITSTGEMRPSMLEIGQNVSFNGTCTRGTLRACCDAAIYAPYAMSGNVTGPRYEISAGGKILVGGRGPNAIPGTAAGTCDDTSIYG